MMKTPYQPVPDTGRPTVTLAVTFTLPPGDTTSPDDLIAFTQAALESAAEYSLNRNTDDDDPLRTSIVVWTVVP
jgi:hypothetical protein